MWSFFYEFCFRNCAAALTKVKTIGRNFALARRPTSRRGRLFPSAAAEGAAREGLRYPEWDWRRRAYRPDYRRVFAAPVRGDGCEWSPPRETLRRIAKVRRRFEAYRPRREQARAQIEGDDLDLDAVVRARADCLAGAELSDRIYLSDSQAGPRRRGRASGRRLAVDRRLDRGSARHRYRARVGAGLLPCARRGRRHARGLRLQFERAATRFASISSRTFPIR